MPCRIASPVSWARKPPCSCPPAPCATRSRILVHCRPGDEIIAADVAHIFTSEAGGGSALAGAQTWPLATKRGIFSGAQVEAALRDTGGHHNPRSRLVAVEQTVNRSGGAVWPLDALEEVGRTARAPRPLHAHGRRAHSQCGRGKRHPCATHGRTLRQRLGRSLEGARLPGRRRAGGLEGVHRRRLALEAPPGRRAPAIRHVGCRGALRLGPQCRASRGGPRQCAAPRRKCSAIFRASAS